MKRVTIAQIAAEVGLAKSTVSCVLNGKPNPGVSPARAALVHEAAKRLNYRPSAAARAMRTGRFNAVGMILSDKINKISPFITMWRAMLDELHQRNLTLTIGQLPDEELTNEACVPRLLGEWAVDGLIVDYVSELPERMLHLINEHHIPSVWINNRMDADCVYPDDMGAFRMATEHLLSLGHQRIAYMSWCTPHHYSHRDRRAGYAAAMKSAGLAVRDLSHPKGLPRVARLEQARALLRQPDRPSAFMCWEKDDAFPLLLAASEMGLQVPRDLSLICAHHEPTDEMGLMLSHVLVPAIEMGREAVRMLQRRIERPDVHQDPVAIPLTFNQGSTIAKPPA